MKHVICLSVWILTFLVGGALFWTSNQVQDASAYNSKLAKLIKSHEEKITILTAEWHYLNSPAYLDRLTTVAFNEGENKPMMLADMGKLPDPEVVLLPVRKPEIPESFKKAEPVLVAEAKKVQPTLSKTQARPAQPSRNDTREFSMVLASWTQ